MVEAQDVKQLMLHCPVVNAALTAQRHRLTIPPSTHMRVASVEMLAGQIIIRRSSLHQPDRSKQHTDLHQHVRMNPLQQSSLVLYAPIQRLDVEVVPLVGAGKEANAGGEGEGVHSSFDDLQLLRS